jgi:hypothetical protein
MITTGKNRIMIFGPKTDGTYVVEFRTAEGESSAISIPKTETAVIRHFQERMHKQILAFHAPAGPTALGSRHDREVARVRITEAGRKALREGACMKRLTGYTGNPVTWLSKDIDPNTRAGLCDAFRIGGSSRVWPRTP